MATVEAVSVQIPGLAGMVLVLVPPLFNTCTKAYSLGKDQTAAADLILPVGSSMDSAG